MRRLAVGTSGQIDTKAVALARETSTRDAKSDTSARRRAGEGGARGGKSDSTFGERDLVFLYQEQLRNGRQSNFFRLDDPKREGA